MLIKDGVMLSAASIGTLWYGDMCSAPCTMGNMSTVDAATQAHWPRVGAGQSRCSLTVTVVPTVS